jgi:hypothetical protein
VTLGGFQADVTGFAGSLNPAGFPSRLVPEELSLFMQSEPPRRRVIGLYLVNFDLKPNRRNVPSGCMSYFALSGG